jgi:hypothetical protein
MERESKSRGSFLDRLAMAFAGAVFGALTFACFAVVSIFFFGSAEPSLAFAIAHFSLSEAGIAIVVVCALIGFVLDPERLSAFFSFLWGTSRAWESPRLQALALAVVVAAIVLFAFQKQGGAP